MKEMEQKQVIKKGERGKPVNRRGKGNVIKMEKSVKPGVRGDRKRGAKHTITRERNERGSYSGKEKTESEGKRKRNVLTLYRS